MTTRQAVYPPAALTEDETAPIGLVLIAACWLCQLQPVFIRQGAFVG